MPPLAPHSARHLPGSAWTRRGDPDALCHWRVIEVRGEDAILVAVLDDTRRDRIPWRDLRDRARWLPGWR